MTSLLCRSDVVPHSSPLPLSCGRLRLKTKFLRPNERLTPSHGNLAGYMRCSSELSNCKSIAFWMLARCHLLPRSSPFSSPLFSWCRVIQVASAKVFSGPCLLPHTSGCIGMATVVEPRYRLGLQVAVGPKWNFVRTPVRYRVLSLSSTLSARAEWHLIWPAHASSLE